MPVAPFSSAELAAAANGGRLLDGLAALEAERTLRLARLGATCALPVIGHERLMALTPDFSVIRVEIALRDECVALRDELGGLLVAVSDPFNSDLLDGLGARLTEAFGVALADREDVAACLARHEDEVRRAVGLTGSGEALEGGEEVEELSLKRISADASPVVKLVNSTLYDALKQ
ncbi:MAG: type II/IV secretion system protein, partial [Proteobacteria bacterium]|nr:type II/IV secretion system protein [Pseudomonadota bacterium]